jgi:DNA-binding response OmpR family regulator
MAPQTQAARVLAAALHSPATMATTAEQRILLLDDETAVSAPVSRYFRNLGWSVDVASEVEEAEALIAHRRYDLAILDLRLTSFGNADGLDIIREVRKRDHWTTVVVLSAYVSPEVEVEALRLGADAVLRKPQPLAELARLARDLMGYAS